jgi:hypothetical protein
VRLWQRQFLKWQQGRRQQQEQQEQQQQQQEQPGKQWTPAFWRVGETIVPTTAAAVPVVHASFACMWLSDRAYAQGVMLWHALCVMLAGPLLMMNTARVSLHYTHDTLPACFPTADGMCPEEVHVSLHEHIHMQ